LCAGDDLDDAFAGKKERRLPQALTLQYDKVIFILEPSEPAKAAIGKYVTVFDYPDGRLAIRHHGVELAYRTFDAGPPGSTRGIIADNKRLGPKLAMIRRTAALRAELSGARSANKLTEHFMCDLSCSVILASLSASGNASLRPTVPGGDRDARPIRDRVEV
jgi:hypothetical protein